jgi:hypothetical protein
MIRTSDEVVEQIRAALEWMRKIGAASPASPGDERPNTTPGTGGPPPRAFSPPFPQPVSRAFPGDRRRHW